MTLTGTGWGGEEVRATATSDAAGLASLDGVAAGEGFVLRVDAAKDGAVTRPDVSVRAGRTTDLGTVLVGAVVGVEGRVVDEKGDGVANADVRALVGFENPMEMLSNLFEMFTSMGREPTPLSKTKSGADGRFTLADVPPGPVVVRADAAGRRMATVKVKADAETPPAPVTLKLEPGADVAGVVVGDRGAPIEGATVAIMRTEGGDDMMDWMSRRIFAVTGAGGRFEAVVEPATKGYRAIVEAAGYPTTVGPAFAAGAKDVRVVLQRGAELVVRLLTEGDDKPVAGATVSLMVGNIDAGEGSEESGAMPSAVTDAEGVARIAARPGKVQMLLVMAPGRDFMMMSPRGGMGGDMGGLSGEAPNELTADRSTEVTLRIKTAVVVTGTVRASDGTPLAGCEVRSLSFFGGAGKAAFQTDAQGAYKVPVTAMFGNAGAMLSFRAPGFVAETANVTIDEAARKAGTVTHDVKLKRAATLRGRVVDAEGKPIAGAKVSVEGAGFGLEQMMGGGTNVLTAKDGAYVLEGVGPSGESANPFEPRPARRVGTADAGEADEPPKVSVVVVEAEGFVEGRSEGITVKEGAQVTVPPVKLSRGATIRGTVLGPDRRPAVGAKVEVSIAAADAKGPRMRFRMNGVDMGQRSFTTDKEGRFEAAACEVGTATLTVSAAGAAPSRRTVKLESEDASPTVTVDLRPAVRIDGVVLDDAGKPVKGVRVAVEGQLVGLEGDDAYVPEESATTKDDGRFVLDGLPSGTVTLAAYHAGYRPLKTTAATGASVELRVAARSAADARRLQEIQKEIGEVSQRYVSAKDDKEREAIQKRLVELSQEQMRLQGDGPVFAEPSDDPPSGPR
ncbi:MAG: carboxypeptidase-like regulatory domain-containing protein [Planctomycetota bacterium]